MGNCLVYWVSTFNTGATRELCLSLPGSNDDKYKRKCDDFRQLASFNPGKLEFKPLLCSSCARVIVYKVLYPLTMSFKNILAFTWRFKFSVAWFMHWVFTRRCQSKISIIELIEVKLPSIDIAWYSLTQYLKTGGLGFLRSYIYFQTMPTD